MKASALSMRMIAPSSAWRPASRNPWRDPALASGMSIRAPALVRSKIIQHTRLAGKDAKKARAEQHGGEARIGPQVAVKMRTHEKECGKKSEAEERGAVQLETAQRQPCAVDDRQGGKQQQKRSGQSKAQTENPRQYPCLR